MKFEEYLQNKHAEEYKGLDDEMSDAFNEWLVELPPDDYIKYADEFHESNC